MLDTSDLKAGTSPKKITAATPSFAIPTRERKPINQTPTLSESKAINADSLFAPLGEMHHNLGYSDRSSRTPISRTMDKYNLSPRKSRTEMRITSPDKHRLRPDPATNTKTSSPKKTKSSTNLAALLGRGKSKSKDIDQGIKNKENEPPRSDAMAMPPPIWAQFSSQENTDDAKVATKDVGNPAEEKEIYMARGRSCTKTKTTYDQLATDNAQGVKIPIKPPAEGRSEPKSNVFGLLRKRSNSRPGGRDVTSAAAEGNLSSRPASADEHFDKTQGTTKNQSRVRAAVAAFSSKNSDAAQIVQPARNVPVNIDAEFEAMLEARNIAPEVKEKMRALDQHIKANLLKQNSGAPQPVDSGSAGSRTPSRPGSGKRADTSSSVASSHTEATELPEKKSRPRSFTGFTLGKTGSSPKKQKQSKSPGHTRGKSADLPRSTSTTSLNSIASSSSFSLFGKAPKPAVPKDFISYLKTNSKPEDVEVGKIQKLRQLLRNETVSWVDEFITEGGMIELVNLLYRIIDIEWREEHEDNLLHHTLTCLKALTTTSAAMQQFFELQQRLFPTLLALLFSSGEERKAPSEFTTRGLIISLLQASITSSPTPDMAHALLSYLRDPQLKDTPVSFVAEMHRPRPFKKWHNEINSVSKEVFWIFLHSVNIIQYPATLQMDTPYNVRHFPMPRPPVPAAPYVGSVEWDATIYLATHLDLLNAIIASLGPAERNQVRTELRDSGFEKLMGGTLRTCKEKFYGHVHAALSTWAGAARDDEWDSKDVREGPPREPHKRSKSSSPRKADRPPVLDMPKLDLGDAAPLSPLMFAEQQPKFDAWL